MKIAILQFGMAFEDEDSNETIAQAMEEVIRQDRNWPNDETLAIHPFPEEPVCEDGSMDYEHALARIAAGRLAMHIGMMNSDSVEFPIKLRGKQFAVKAYRSPGTFRERLRVEEVELAGKIEELRGFMESESYGALASELKDMMASQLVGMNHYFEALSKRISYLTE